MRITLDCSPAKIAEYTARYGVEFWQLCTPLTQYARAKGVPYILDNGCFKEFDEEVWFRLLDRADLDRPLLVCLPDIVGNAQRTDELFRMYHSRTQELPRALVVQDGIERMDIPWTEIKGVFIGGSTQFKYSQAALDVAKTAKMLKKWVHVGRINTIKRMRFWKGIADSGDGSGMSRFDHMLEDVLRELAAEASQSILQFHASN